MIRTEEEHLAHYGILRRSGRYPWGSGASETTRNRSFLDTIQMHKNDGMTEAEIAKGYGISTTTLRAARSIALAQQKQEKQLTAQRYKERGWSNVEIGKRMGLNESSVRALLKPSEKDTTNILHTTADMLRNQVAEKKMIDVGVGVERHLGITKNRLDTAVAMLKEEGYPVHSIKIQQLGTGKFTTMQVLAEKGTSLQHVQRNRADIQQIMGTYSEDHGRSFLGIQPPLNINSRRIKVNYGPDGGRELDGLIYVRPGVPELSLGKGNYSQVRIAVDGTHYLKGMAVYNEHLPAGTDIVFNTSKPNTGRKKDAMKELEPDPENPFGSIVHQIHGPDGKVISAMNIVGTKEGAGEEGAWDNWSKNLSSQMLSKQSPDLARQQLDLTFDRRKREFDEINSLTNPTVRKDLLLKFADSTDASAAHLEAANLPRQATKVLLPVTSVKPTEIYAPSFNDGERVVLIRYPHGGTFEIPELTVNNRNREARRILGPQARDAVGIHHKVAQQLSGADFDGDTVLVIPNKHGSVAHTPALQDLKGFDPQKYRIPKDSPIPRMDNKRKGKEMGRISNLITDMTIKGAPPDEVARAVKHSMVVIDAEKHELDFVQSEKDHGILDLKEKYQGTKRSGASTIISRAGAELRVPERIDRPFRKGGPIDPLTGEKVFEPTGRMVPVRKRTVDPHTGKVTYVDTGRTKPAEIRTTKLAEARDAFKLVSKENTVMERLYAAHSNQLKVMANQARKEAVHVKPAPQMKSAKKVYASEVASLDAKLNVALKNAPLERQSQLLANVAVSQKKQANPHMEPEDVKKIKQLALNTYRNRTGAGKEKIKITQSEWNAIQAGAISKNKLEQILANSDPESIKMLALPKESIKMTPTKLRRAESMFKSGYTQAEVADALGVGLTTLKVALNE